MSNAPHWLQLVPEELRQQIDRFDPALMRLVGLAAYIGDEGKDQTPVSYSSLLIALIWCDHPVSDWFRDFIGGTNISIRRILQHRGIKAANEEQSVESHKKIIDRLERDIPFHSGMVDLFSRSATAMLRNASAIADETGDSTTDLRHLLAAYVFRNPSYHEQDLLSWGFDIQRLRQACSKFLAEENRDSIGAWIEILRGYLPEDLAPAEANVPGTILSTLPLDGGMRLLLRKTEALAAGSGGTLNSELLLTALLSPTGETEVAVDVQDLKQLLFADPDVESHLRSRLPQQTSPIAPFSGEPFSALPSSLPVSPGLKRILIEAQTVAFTTSSIEALGGRHLIASMLVTPDTTALEIVRESGIQLAQLRRGLLHLFTRRWLNDDGNAWRQVLVGLTPPTVAGYDGDNPEQGDDRLDVTRYAAAFATIMAARTVDPPLSIGIFGDWGSGKSFFMRLMRQQTHRMSELSDLDASGVPLFHRNVVSIQFNAWHYAETNLWASLVQTILEALHEAIHRQPGNLLDRLTLLQAAQEEAQRKLERIEEKRDAASQQLTELESRRDTQEQQVDALKSKDLLTAMKEEILSDEQIDAALQAAEDKLGIKDAKTLRRQVGNLVQVVDEARALKRRTKSDWQWLSQTQYKNDLFGFAVIAFAAGLLLLVVLAKFDIQLQTVSKLVSEAVVVVSALVFRSRQILDQVKGAFARIGALRGRIEAMQAERRQTHDSEIAAAVDELHIIDTEYEQVKSESDSLDAQAVAIQKEIEESSPSRRIASLIEQRLSGRDYGQYLGIVAAIRSDFQILSDCLSHRDEETLPEDSDYRPIDRIVLYIDDLDRCPSEKVVSVLEAVHLMLAFPLFVVVVGVDIRWAGTSLHERYPRHLDAGLQNSGGEKDKFSAGSGASALDYLEKIFQIPFWLPPMEEQASRDMIAAMIPVPAAGAGNLEHQTTGTATRQETSTAAVSDPAATTPSKTSSNEETGETTALMFEPRERDFILSLAGAVGKSPRRVKRFVNTYRILKASCDALERENFVVEHGDRGTYQAAMTLLAITTGAPRHAIDILRELNALSPDKSLKDFENRIDGLTPLHGDAEEAYVREALRVYRKAASRLLAADDPRAEPHVADLVYWGPRAARFSFRSGRI